MTSFRNGVASHRQNNDFTDVDGSFDRHFTRETVLNINGPPRAFAKTIGDYWAAN